MSNEELWILGTQSLDDVIGKLEALKRDHNKDPLGNYLFIQDRFEIISPLRSELNRLDVDNPYQFAKRIYNDLVHLLNVRPNVASFILVILGQEILDDENFIKLGFKTVFTWLLDEMQFAIIDRIDSAPPKVGKIQKPEVIFTKIIPKPESNATSGFKAGRRKYNKLLETHLKEFDKIVFSFINVGEITSQATEYFHKNGTLNDSGNLAFWVSISDIFKTKLLRLEEQTKPVDNDAQTDDFLLDDHIKIKAEKLISKERNYRRPREMKMSNSRQDNLDRHRNTYYNRDRPASQYNHYYDQNDRFHFHKNNNTRGFQK